MQIVNKTKNIVLSSEFVLDNSFWFKLRGLMFTKNTKKTLVFEFKEPQFVPLHMLFVFYSIDVVWLDSNSIVVELKEQFKPFTFVNPKKKSRYVIELPFGTIQRTKTKIGDKICIKQ